MKSSRYLVATLVGVMVAGNAQAAGFEKSVMWSGKEAGYAGAGMSRISGSQSLVFNPAGLAGEGNGDASLNMSPTWIKLEGSITSQNRREETDHNFSPIAGGTLSYKINENFGLGVGAYVAGGSKALYDGVDVSAAFPAIQAFKPRIFTDFKVIEYSIGAGYQLSPGWRVGAAWRIAQASGGFSTMKHMTTANLVNYISVINAKQTKYNGFRLGLQYEAPNKDWGFGASFRNGVTFAAKGIVTGQVVSTATGANVPTSFGPEATLGTSLPWAASIGANRQMGNFNLLGGVDFVRYSENKELQVTATQSVGGGAFSSLPNIALNWKDMWNFRVGTEYSGFDAFKLRFGYALTTPVTPVNDARATLSPPGTGHLFTIGAGTSFWDRFELDGAFEYALNSADGTMTPGTANSGTASASKEMIGGVNTNFQARTLAVHTGLTYKF